MSLLDDLRVRELISSAEQARQLSESLKARGKDPVDALTTLSELHRELGERVHAWVVDHVGPLSTQPPSPVPRAAAPKLTEAPEDTGFFHEDFEAPEAVEDLPVEESEDTDEVAPSLVHELASERPPPRQDSASQEYPPWLLSLDQLLISLAMPADPLSPSELAAEAVRVQLVSCHLEQEWADYPEPLQIALLGLLSCRARHLLEHLHTDVGPKLALVRMRRYRKAAGLPPVVGLISTRQPESGSWTRDALRWWEVLVEGLRPFQPPPPN